jgi:hypothetical protein
MWRRQVASITDETVALEALVQATALFTLHVPVSA